MPRPSTSQASLASSSSTPSGGPRPTQQLASNASKSQHGSVEGDTLDPAVTIASLDKEVTGNILKKIQVTSETAKRVSSLKQEIDDLGKVVTILATMRNSGKEIPETLQKTIDELTSKWMEIEESATKIARRDKRFFSNANNAKKLQDLVEDMSSCMEHVMLRVKLENALTINRIPYNAIQARDTSLIYSQTEDENLFMLPYAGSAAYDANSARPRQPCLEGTREDILEDVWTWVELCTQDLPPTDNTPQGRGDAVVSIEEAWRFIYWICGLAGTGKTTIACSIAKRCKQEGILAASFFFSCFDSKCNNPNLLFTTISHQLCRIHPAYKASVIAVIKANPDLVLSVPAVQLEKLILEPLEQLLEPFARLIIVIDAFDECCGDDSDYTLNPFYTLSLFKDRLARFFLFIMTSRPEPGIVAHFDHSGPLGDVTMRLSLHTVGLNHVLHDINRFLTYHLKERVVRRFPQGQLSDEDIATLTTLSEGSFIFARTVVDLLTDQSSTGPVATLERIVQRQWYRSNSVSILKELYRQVLDEAHPNAQEEFQDVFRQIVGTLVVATEPISVATLAALLGLNDRIVWSVLSRLYSVLHIPDEYSQPIHFIHSTFPEFLLQASSALSPPLPSRFSFEAAEQHCAVFVRCLITTGSLLRCNIADLRDPCVFKKEVPDLSDRIRQCIPPHLSYACRNWSVHFRLGSGTSVPTTVHTLFSKFLHQHLLGWLEVCSLLNTLAEAPAAIDAARHTCQSLEEPFLDLVPFLLDARRFVLTYTRCIDAAPLQVHHSALVFAPNSSLISQTYQRERGGQFLAPPQGTSRQRGPRVFTFSGHGHRSASCAAFSPDTLSYVSGGYDGMLKIWQTSTSSSVSGIQTPHRWIMAVAYSPDGLHIATGGTGGLFIWHAMSGAKILAITNDDVKHVAYTADGSKLLSVNSSDKVQLWNVLDGACLLSLDGGGCRRAGISPDGAVIVYTRDTSLLLHDISSGGHESLELPDRGRAATFSSDSRYVAAATHRAIRIWSHRQKALVRSIDVSEKVWSGPTFSPDSSQICCGCANGTVYIWPVESDAPARELTGHADIVMDVAWSPDGSQVISTSVDRTIRLWDITDDLPVGQGSSDLTSTPRVMLATMSNLGVMISDLPSSVALSPLFTSDEHATDRDIPIPTLHPSRASAWDHAIRLGLAEVLPSKNLYLWTSLTGQHYSSARLGCPPVVSNNGILIAHPLCREVYVRDLSTSRVVATLTPAFESGEVDSIIFSSNAALLATGSGYPGVVEMWDVEAGVRSAYHHDHAGRIRCLRFSSDSRCVVSGSDDKTVRVFDIANKHISRILGPHEDYVTQLMLTTDDKSLVTQDSAGSLYIWNIESGSLIASFPPSDTLWLTTLQFTLHGFSVSSEDDEHTVELWKAGERVWPVYIVSEDGWVYAKGPGYTRRCAWLLPERRHPVCSEGPVLCVYEKDKNVGNGTDVVRKLVELDMSRLLDSVGISYEH